MTRKRSLTGITPSGTVHIGNYLGMIRPALDLQESYECVYFISDLHSLTKLKDPKKMREYTFDLVATWLACGLDTEKHILFLQSDVPMVTEFAWYLTCVTGHGLLEKAHAFKDASAKSREINHGVFAYPILMAADIIMYDVDVVPVGKDQKQHVEMARDMAGSFNSKYGQEVMKLPKPVIREEVMIIPGLDGQKMSKSYNNTIPLFASEKELRKLVLSMKTDSTSLEEPKSLAGTVLSDYVALFLSKDKQEDLEKRLQAGGLGWGHAKQELFEAMNESLKGIRERYEELRRDESALRSELDNGAERAREIALPVLNRVRKAQGFDGLRG